MIVYGPGEIPADEDGLDDYKFNVCPSDLYKLDFLFVTLTY